MRSIGSPEFTEWMAFDELEPITGGHQAALVAAAIANVNRPKSHPGYSPEDMLPDVSPPLTEAEKAARLRTKIDSVMFAAGGRVKGVDAPKPGGRRQAKRRVKEGR